MCAVFIALVKSCDFVDVSVDVLTSLVSESKKGEEGGGGRSTGSVKFES